MVDPRAPRVRGPSEIVDGDVRIGGRVIARDGRTIAIADAFATVRCDVDEEAHVGDSIVVEAHASGGVLTGARVVDLHAGSANAADVQRFLFGGVGKRLARRAQIVGWIREMLVADGFLEVETPLVVPSPGLDLHLDAVPAGDGYLITSPEYQMKRLVAGGILRCFQIVRCFRRGERGPLHNPEFTMLEWYAAFAGYEDAIALTERLVASVVARARGTTHFRLRDRVLDVSPPFARISVAEAFARFAATGEDELLRLAREDEGEYFRLLVERVEPALAVMTKPVFLVDYPAEHASLARRKPSDPRFAERFELYAGGIELCNGFGELTEPTEQRARLERDREERARRGLDVYPIDETFLAALEGGLPPCAGNALGLDRLVALALDAPTIADVLAFPAGTL